jgi:hypothetical protein
MRKGGSLFSAIKAGLTRNPAATRRKWRPALAPAGPANGKFTPDGTSSTTNMLIAGCQPDSKRGAAQRNGPPRPGQARVMHGPRGAG